MQFKVPQFLEIEDKIFGPFTFKEFVYLAGGAGMCFVIYKLLGLILGAIPILLIAGFSLMLTFYRPNNKPFIYTLESMFKYGLQSRLYIWKRRQVKKANEVNGNIEEPARNAFSIADARPHDSQQRVGRAGETKTNMMPRSEMRLSGNKLRDLAWSLDVLDLNKHRDINT